MTLLSRLFRIPFAVRLAATLWVALLVGVGVRIVMQKPGAQSVVPIYRTAGERWVAGEDVYAWHPGLDAYRNPPVVAAAFAGLNILPGKTQELVWRGLSAVVFLLGLRAFIRHALPPLTRPQAGVLAAAAVPMVLLSLNNGQVNVILAGAVLFGAAAADHGRWWPAAGWLGLAAWLKVYPVAAGLVLCVLFPRRLGWRLAVVLAAGFAAPFLTQDPGYVLAEYRSFLTYVRQEDRTYSFLSQVPRDWTMVPRIWLDVIPAPAVSRAVSVAAGAVVAGLTLLAARRVGPAGALPTATSLSLVWMCLFGPATENPTYTLLAMPVGVALATWRGWKAVAGWAAFGLFLAVVVRGIFPTSEVLPLRTAQPVGAALLLAGLVSEAAGRRVIAPGSSAASAGAPGLSRPVSR